MAEQSGGMQAAGAGTSIAGDLTSAFGAYYQARSQKYLARSRALTFEFQGGLADINARAALRDADAIFAAGRYEQLRLSLAAGEEKASMTTALAGSGFQLGDASGGRELASRELQKQLDLQQARVGRTQARAAAMSRVVNLRNEANLFRTNAEIARRTSRAISPGAAFHIGLAGGSAGTNIAASYSSTD